MTWAATIAAALGSVGAYFAWKSRKSALRRETAKEVEREDELREIRKAEIREAVYSNDDAKLNQIVKELVG